MWGLAAGLAPGALPCPALLLAENRERGAGSRSRLRRRLCLARASPLRRAAGGVGASAALVARGRGSGRRPRWSVAARSELCQERRGEGFAWAARRCRQ